MPVGCCGADPKANRSHAFELLGQMPAHDADKPGRKTALRGYNSFRLGGERADVFGCPHVLGEVEVVDAEPMSRRCD